jgi:hypothetical protein
MAAQRWRTQWTDERGRVRELVFDSLDKRMIARIDFQLKCLHVASGAIHVPAAFDLEEVIYGLGNSNGSTHFLPDFTSTLSQLR